MTLPNPTQTTYPLERAGTYAQQDWTFRLAQGVSYLINPFLLPPALFGLLLRHHGAPPAEIGWAVVIGLVFFAFIPLGYIAWLYYRSAILSIEIPDRLSRTRPFFISVVSYAAALGLMYGSESTAAPLLLAVISCYIVNTALAALINLRWKISLHTISIGGFISILLVAAHVPTGLSPPVQGQLDPGSLYLLLPLVGLLMWARVRTRAHTFGQTVSGAVFGLTVPLVELASLYALGVL